ncbi:beta-propeller fold lactonase family protein [Roseibium salinum]|nr:beta-propeller fold lactonase family protein [Roseibium salinum]
MAASEDGRWIYVAWRGEPYRLFSFAVDGNARRLNCLGQASLPASMCYAMVSSCGRRLLTSSYTGSTIAISPIGDDGTAGEPIMTRDAMHAHCLVEAPNGLVYATSLRGDCVQTYRFDAGRNDLSPLARLDVPAGSGPRHIVFTADGSRAYLLSEFAGTLTRLDVDPHTGALAIRERVALLPEGEKKPGPRSCGSGRTNTSSTHQSAKPHRFSHTASAPAERCN